MVSSTSKNFASGQVDLGGLRTDTANKIRKRRVWILQHFPCSLALAFLLHSAAGPCLTFFLFLSLRYLLVALHLSCQVHLELRYGFIDAMPENPGETSVFLLGNVFILLPPALLFYLYQRFTVQPI